MKKNRGKIKLLSLALGVFALFVVLNACMETDIDHSKSNIDFSMDLSTTSDDITLNENNANDVALAIDWTAATDKGSDYILEYQYELSLVGADASNSISEYVDGNVFERSYTNKELQDILVGWGVPTDTKCQVQAKVTASYDGPTIVIPEEGATVVNVRTYGAPQYAADEMFISGTAVGDEDIAMVKDGNRFSYTGGLTAGSINFPVNYMDDAKLNSISPVNGDMAITEEAMSSQMVRTTNASSWVINEALTYRVTVDLASQSVSILDASKILEIDSLYLGGSATNNAEIKINQALEDESIYAWKGELKAGSLYLPIYYGGSMATAILPSENGVNEITDGTAMSFASGAYAGGTANNWSIPSDGVYRVILNTSSRTITIYSAEKDLQNYKITYAKTFPEAINPFTQDLTELWMLKSDATDGNVSQDAEHKDPGFNTNWVLKQSLADPGVFIYSGDVLPSGGVKFCCDNFANNVFAFGYRGEDVSRGEIINVDLDVPTSIYGGQGNNRYSYIGIPEGANYIEVRITEQRADDSNGRTVLIADITFKTK